MKYFTKEVKIGLTCGYRRTLYRTQLLEGH